MDDLLVGLIGAGNMGKGLAGAVAPVEGARLAAVADVADGAAAAAAADLGEGIDAYTDPGDLLARQDIGAVLVAVPNWLHPEAVKQAAAAGKHIFCEKPMALTAADARSMIAACEAAGVKLMIGQVLRYNTPFVWIIERVRSGEFGEPCAMQVTRVGGPWGGRYATTWRMEKAKTGGPLFEISAHEIDFIRQVLGEAESVHALKANFINPEVDYEDYATVAMAFERGRKATLLSGHCGYLTSYDGKVYCTEGTVVFSHSTRQVMSAVKGGEQRTMTYEEVGAGREPGVRREVREFIEAVLNDTDVTIPGEQGLRNTEIAQAAEISATDSRVVELPLP
ncbi:MAG TPA: Gfo/Idh/MocA family oxidoreductase [Armatimonadota bacterium]|nr:Gfo/Idh/MocA family oxidoreductase [Armatimonadota bacterium]